MNLNNITFPYPVLGSFDDILPVPQEPVVEVTKDKTNYHFDIILNYENKDIERLVSNDFADIVCEITCETTRFRKCHTSKSTHLEIDVPRRAVAGRIVFSCTITVKKNIFRYINSGFHPDYDGHTFNMEPGDLLAMFTPFYYVADIKYDKLKAVGTFMEITPTEDEIPATILDKNKIELKLPQILYEQYRNNPDVNKKADILHASIVLNSLIYALCRIENFLTQEGGETKYTTKWAETIIYRINTEDELQEFRDQDPEDWRVDKLAQILLGKPYERLFTYLINHKDTSDE